MSTRGLFTFVEDDKCHHVYKHYDCYPSGAIEALEKAKELAWPLPRFEADEFAAAFIAANKTGPGDLRLVGSNCDWADVAPWDIEYHYIVSREEGGGLKIQCRSVHKSDFAAWKVRPAASLEQAVEDGG